MKTKRCHQMLSLLLLHITCDYLCKHNYISNAIKPRWH
uniref:Uncharacterized protein n=1 Tax=Arundo donax TaxID=35708 RepID=A0A0A8YPH1_ARUDO